MTTDKRDKQRKKKHKDKEQRVKTELKTTKEKGGQKTSTVEREACLYQTGPN